MLFLFLAAVCLASCGGGGGGSSKPRAVLPSATVDWPQRSRNIAAPSSALSVSFLLHDPIGAQADFAFAGDRSTNLAAHSETYKGSSAAPTGNYTLSGTFYPQAGEAGTAVATFSVDVTLKKDGTFTKQDGTPLGAVGFTGTVGSVVIDPNQTVPMSVTQQLTATVFDKNNAVLALSPGSLVWSVTNGNSNLTVTPDGNATGVADGNATVSVAVDGVTSEAVTVSVVTRSVVVNDGARDLTYDPVNDTVLVAPLYGGQTLDPVNASTGEVQTKVNLPASVLWVSMSGDKTNVLLACDDHKVRVLDAGTYAVKETIACPDSSNPTGIFGLPGTSDSFVLNLDQTTYVMDGPTPRPNHGSIGNMEALSTDGTKVVGFNFGGNYHIASIDSTGLTNIVSSNRGAAPTVAYQGGFVVGAGGDYFDGNANYLGPLPVIPAENRVVGSLSGTKEVAFISWNPAQCQVMDVTTQTEVGRFNVPGFGGGLMEPISAGPHRMACRNFSAPVPAICIMTDSALP
ncbi:MAG TPA: hypothetical protein VG944_17465 [Fimbriimonas sp.]|nr:hypothetical protein [Fimbriimonas sp.]